MGKFLMYLLIVGIAVAVSTFAYNALTVTESATMPDGKTVSRKRFKNKDIKAAFKA